MTKGRGTWRGTSGPGGCSVVTGLRRGGCRAGHMARDLVRLVRTWYERWPCDERDSKTHHSKSRSASREAESRLPEARRCVSAGPNWRSAVNDLFELLRHSRRQMKSMQESRRETHWVCSGCWRCPTYPYSTSPRGSGAEPDRPSGIPRSSTT